jgi:hypothetical protein
MEFCMHHGRMRFGREIMMRIPTLKRVMARMVHRALRMSQVLVLGELIGFYEMFGDADYICSEAAELKLADLVKGSVVKVGDVLAYKRKFSQLDMTVEKDIIVRLHILRCKTIC